MKCLGLLIDHWRPSRNIHLIVLIIFLIHATLVSPVFFPSLSNIGVWDEATYINEGRELLDGKLPLYSENPAMAGLYALTYLPVRTSPYWLVHSCSIGRFVLFGLLWLASYLVASEVAGLASPFIMIALVATSPAFVHLLSNGTDALFAAVSGFALWQFLSFHRTRVLKHLWFCSFFLGVAALSRSEGPVLFLIFLGLSLVSCVPAGVVGKGLTACLVPFTALVGGYIILYGLCTGDFRSGSAKRSYIAFEQGQGMAFPDSHGTKQFYVEGQLDARRLFGTPEENHYSVLTAIRRNPAAYLQRIPRLAKQFIKDAVSGYGWYFGALCFAFAARGVIDLIKRRSFMPLATLVLWPAYCVLYVLLNSQPSHVLIPFLPVFALASVGISAFLVNLDTRRERYLWSAVFLALAIAALGRCTVPNGPLAATLIILLGFALIWLVMDRYRGVPTRRTIGCFILLSLGLTLRFAIPNSGARMLGSDPDEQATLYLRTHFASGTRIGAWGPGKIWSAKMDPVTMTRDLRYMKSAQDLSEWMARERVEAIYVDDFLREFEPALWDIIQKQIGDGLAVAFESGERAVQILVRTPQPVAGPQSSQRATPVVWFLGSTRAIAGRSASYWIHWDFELPAKRGWNSVVYPPGQVWPRNKAKHMNARLRLVGLGTDSEIAREGVDIDGLGWVNDTAEEISTWSMMIMPIHVGGGTRVKIAEAFSRKCPVVATSLGAFGYKVV